MSLYLSANKLVSDYGTVGDYLIEWRLGSVSGEAVFISGEGTDPLLQAIHPFEDEVVQSGTLYPVIIYAYFNGQKYTLQPNYGDNYSPDLLQCLELYFVVIDGVNCANGNSSGSYPYQYYTHIYQYFNELSPALDASRTIKFDLNADGTTNFFAWYFNAYSVVDRFTATYYHINDLGNPELLVDWKVGFNNSGDNFLASPKIYSRGSINSVIDLRLYGHQAGDYLLLNVVPRTEEPSNPNTDWQLYLKCLEFFPDNDYDPNMRVIDTNTIAMNYNEASCRWEMSWKNLTPYNLPAHYSNYLDSTWLDNIHTPPLSGRYYEWATNTFKIYFRNSISITRGWTNSSTTCFALIGTLNIINISNQITYTFTHADDYNHYKSSYDTIMANPVLYNKSTDRNVSSYYNHIQAVERIATTCGDSYESKKFFALGEDNFIFDDDNRTITFTQIPLTVLPDNIPCNGLYSEMTSLQTQINQAVNGADFNITTNVRYGGFRLRYYNATETKDASFNYQFAYKENDQSLIGVFPTGWGTTRSFSTSATITGWGFDMQTGNAEITDLNDPENNFRIRTVLNPDGTYLTSGNAITVYEISDGVVITPTTTTTTTTP